MSKSAMQELKESLQSINERYHLKGDSDWLMNEVLDLVEKYLEKEKEQTIEAFEVGYKSCDIDEAFEINRKLASGEQYYNKTYNKCLQSF